MNDILLEVQNVKYNYCDNIVALEDVSVKFFKGKRHIILGSNGAGKSTLFMLLNGLYRPTIGKVFFEGKPLEYTFKNLQQLRSRVGILFQDPDSQLISASLREDVSFGPMNLKLNLAIVRERVAHALKVTQLEELVDRPVHSLSYGQKKRAGIAGLLAMQPEVLILDEPTAGLDYKSQYDLFELLGKLHRQGISIIISTHDIDLAYSWADITYVLKDGRVVDSCDVDSCKDGRKEVTILEKFSSFHQYGLGTPKVAEIYSELINTGIIASAKNHLHPRDHQQLLRMIKQESTRPHCNPINIAVAKCP